MASRPIGWLVKCGTLASMLDQGLQNTGMYTYYITVIS